LYEVLVELLILEGLSPEIAEAIASMYPEGIYVMFESFSKML